jgi:predicted TIM-barrel fold metal-dependent hydrolase
MAVVRAAIGKCGFIGVKLYPPVGFLPLGNDDPRLDQALTRLYLWCETYGVPITVHAGPGNIFDRAFEEYAKPRNWMEVVKAHPKLRLNLGHFGHQAQAKNHEYWIDEAVELMELPNSQVYADVADCEIPVTEAYVEFLQQRLTQHEVLKERLLYGSDWFMDELEPKPGFSVSDYLPKMNARLASRLFASDETGFFSRNALRFLGLAKADGSPDLEHPNFKRLVRYYRDQPRPKWLGGQL